MRRNPRTLVVRVVSLSALVLNPLTIGITLQAQTESSYIAEPAEWEVDEAVRVLPRYLAARPTKRSAEVWTGREPPR